MGRRGAAFFATFGGAVLVPLTAGALLVTGCEGDDCLGDAQSWGSCSQGELAGGDVDTWESVPVTGQYLDFHGERLWTFDPTPWMGKREPIAFEGYLSLNPDPTADGGGGFAQPAGNLAEFTPVLGPTGWQVQVLNDTCAQYYLRVVLTYAPVTGARGSGGTCAADGGS